MKHISLITALCLISGTSSFCSEGGFTWIFTGSPREGLEYKFNVPLGEKDRWDSVAQETPPLSPGKALRLAREYVEKVAPQSKEPVPWPFPVRPGEKPHPATYVTWEVSDVKLLRHVTSAGDEQWLYVVSINKMMKGVGRQMPRPDVQIPVRMDGTIPEPAISNPDPQGAANGWQPFRSETNRTSAAAAPRRSP
jgi:hypothetical protein